MAADELDLTIEQGVTFSQVITYSVSGSLVNLTGYTARLSVREHVAATSSLLDMTTENSRITLGGAAGTITLALTASVTALLSWDNYAVYDLELVNGATVTRLVEGRVYLNKEVTR